MARRKEAAHGGGHGWFVTFADLMGLLVSVLRDAGRLLHPGSGRSCKSSPARCATPSACRTRCAIPASSKCWACRRGRSSRTPPISIRPRRPRRRRRTRTNSERTYGARFKKDRKFALASASLRQALQEMPEITEASKHIMVEETKQGLNIEIVDQDGRSMFPDGAKEPYERTRKLIQKIAPALKAMPYRVSIIGHTAIEQGAGQAGLRTLGTFRRPRQCGARNSRRRRSADRRTSSWWPARPTPIRCSRTIPSMSPNRRVTITLMREEPPIPADLRPINAKNPVPLRLIRVNRPRRKAGILAAGGDDIRPAFQPMRRTRTILR